MENRDELLSKIRILHKEIREMENVVRSPGDDSKRDAYENGYWPESGLYSTATVNRKRPDSSEEMAFIVPWQME
jgi:hypothetical protein